MIRVDDDERVIEDGALSQQTEDRCNRPIGVEDGIVVEVSHPVPDLHLPGREVLIAGRILRPVGHHQVNVREPGLARCR